MNSDQKKLWKLIQAGELQKMEDYLHSLKYDPFALVRMGHIASGDTTMHLAARHGYLNIVKSLHLDWLVDVGGRNLDLKTPLHEAASNCHADVVGYLLICGVDVNCLKRSDWTPLMMACTKPGNLETVKTLVFYGAKVDLANKDGWDCFHLSCRQGDMDVTTYLFACDRELCRSVSKNGRTPLHTASLHGQLRVLEFLLDECGLSLHRQDSCGSTPLMEAVKGGHLTLVKYITCRDADLDAVDSLGRTVLHVAAECDRDTIIEYLVVECGLDPNARTRPPSGRGGGHSALDWAYKERQQKAIACLLNLGAVDGQNLQSDNICV